MMKRRYLIALASFCICTGVYALPAESPNLISHNELMRVISGLFAVLLIIVCVSWVIKRLNVVKFATSKGFQSIASMALGPKEKLILVKVGPRYLLLGVGASVSTLHDFGEDLPTGFEPDNKATFGEIFKAAVGKK